MNISVVKCWILRSRLRCRKRTFPHRFNPCRFDDGLRGTGNRSMASFI